MIQQFYTLLSAYHDKRSHHCHQTMNAITIILTIFSMLYFSSLIYFMTGSLYLLILLPIFQF